MGDGGPGGARVPLTYGLAARVPVNLKSTGGMEKQTLDRWALSLSLVLSKRRGICVAVLSQGRPYSVTRKWECIIPGNDPVPPLRTKPPENSSWMDTRMDRTAIRPLLLGLIDNDTVALATSWATY